MALNVSETFATKDQMSDAIVPLPTTPAITKADIRAEFDLPFSKMHVVVLRGTGKDKRMALLAAGPGADQFRILDAIAARLCLFDGKKLRMEDLDNFDFDDSMMMSTEMAKVLDFLQKGKTPTAIELAIDELEKPGEKDPDPVQ